MSEPGYIYILINPSMQSLIKVGKTTREPIERAEELSKATGVPTPFIVGYQMAVNNCTKAEQFVHTWLEHKGFRVSDNREFFNAPMTDAINAMLEYKQTLDNDNSDDEAVVNTAAADINSKLWEEVEKIADEYHYGLENKLQDYSEALKYYKQAIKLGSPTACREVGNMYIYGNGCAENTETALEYFKEGIKRGNYSCYGNMMDLYFKNGHADNALKCWDMYSRYIQADNLAHIFCRSYFMFSYRLNLKVKNIENLMPIKDKIIKIQNEWLHEITETNNYSLQSEVSNVLKYMEYVFSADSKENIMCGQDYIRKINQEKQDKIKKIKQEKEINDTYNVIYIVVVVIIGFIIIKLLG